MSEKSKKYILFFAKIFLIISTAVYPFFMVIMTGAGLVYNHSVYGTKIMYTGIFLIFSGILMTSGSICCMFRKKISNIISLILWVSGFTLCITMLYILCVQADYNGWYRNLSPVSDMYKIRIFPVTVPLMTDLIISLTNIHSGQA
ncbi:MAG: hypothetical protein K2L10_10390 [Ruminococcus sp.]|nr:hypothetical protein [Ruminococcus sp.]